MLAMVQFRIKYSCPEPSPLALRNSEVPQNPRVQKFCSILLSLVDLPWLMVNYVHSLLWC